MWGAPENTKSIVEEFVRDGLVRIPSAIDLDPAAPAGRLFRRTLTEQGWLGSDGLDVPCGLTSTPPTRVGDLATVAPRLWDAVATLLGGADRIAPPVRIANAFICNFRTYVESDSDWHVDGDFFVHHPDSPEQVLLIFILWSDVTPGEGATQLAPAATGPILRFIRSRPRGVRSGAVPVPSLVASTAERLEITGKAGDAWILHPLTAHRSMPNPAGPPRFISNPVVALRDPLRLADEPDPSPLEVLTRNLLGEPFHTDPSARRLSFRPDRVNRWQTVGTYRAGEAT
jgi:hypothetical protein